MAFSLKEAPRQLWGSSHQMRKFSKEELAQYSGKNGAPAYVAYKGQVYDVSDSFHWRNGRHWVSHEAGADLTYDLQSAPHGPEFLFRYPRVGILEA